MHGDQMHGDQLIVHLGRNREVGQGDKFAGINMK
jgi:hypothetical protein